MNRILLAIGNYKWGTGSSVIAAFVVFLGGIFITQYVTKGRIDLMAMVNRSSGINLVLEANPGWEYFENHSRTTLYSIRERSSGNTALIDLAVLTSAQMKARACDAAALPPHGAQFAGAAAGMVCFQIVKPKDSESPYVSAVSFTAKAKKSEVAYFYRTLFANEGFRISGLQDSVHFTILDVEDKRHNTVARVSMRSAFDTSYVFIAWTADFR